jgi:hypothetical protein
MKKTIYNVVMVVGTLTVCAILSRNWNFVSSSFNLLGTVIKGAGDIMWVVVGNPSPRSAPAYYSGNIGDDGSGDGLQSLDQYREDR